MDSGDEAIVCAASVTVMAAASVAVVYQRRQKRRSEWVKRYLMSRQSRGAWAAIFREVHNIYLDDYRNLLRMDDDTFHMLLSMVEPNITRQRSRLRHPISARERLTVTLRYLATGVYHTEHLPKLFPAVKSYCQ